MKIYLSLALSITLLSCDQERINTLEQELKNKDEIIKSNETKILELEQTINELKPITKSDSVKSNTEPSELRKFFQESENNALNMLIEEFKFTCPEMEYKDFIVRQKNNFEYEVSFLARKRTDNIGWQRTLYSINPYDKIIKYIRGTYC